MRHAVLVITLGLARLCVSDVNAAQSDEVVRIEGQITSQSFSPQSGEVIQDLPFEFVLFKKLARGGQWKIKLTDLEAEEGERTSAQYTVAGFDGRDIFIGRMHPAFR